MKKQICNCLLSLLAIIFATSSSLGQDIKTNEKINNWFLEQRFILADRNDDALLNRQELQRFNKEFTYFLSNRYFNLSDANRDGQLSFSEMFSRRRSEYHYRYNIERDQLQRLMKQHPDLPYADLVYLKANPYLVATLFENLVWMYENAELVEQLLKDSYWIENNPETLFALHRNLRWMAANPKRARSLYQDRKFTQQLPELIGWRADHKKFIRSNPLLDRFYEISFIPEGIYIKR